MTISSQNYRVAVFNAYEVHGKSAGGEWVRLDAESSPRLADTINGFIFEHEVTPVNLSPPAIVLVHSDDDRRVFRMGVSMIYATKTQSTETREKSREERIRDIADGLREIGSEELSRELDELLRSDDLSWLRAGVAKLAKP